MKEVCSNCGSAVEGYMKYCPYCGSKIVRDTNDDLEKTNESDKPIIDYGANIKTGRINKAKIWGIVTGISILFFISGIIFLVQFSNVTAGVSLLFTAFLEFIVGLVFSLMYGLGFTKSVIIESHNIVFDSGLKDTVHLDGKLISKTSYPQTIYVHLSPEVTIAVIPKLNNWTRYGGRVLGVDFVKVCK